MASKITQPPRIMSGGKGAGTPGNVGDVGEGLKDLYNSVLNEPLPDDILNLLSQFDSDPE